GKKAGRSRGCGRAPALDPPRPGGAGRRARTSRQRLGNRRNSARFPPPDPRPRLKADSRSAEEGNRLNRIGETMRWFFLLALLGPLQAAAETPLVPTGIIGFSPVNIERPGSTDTARAMESAVAAAPESVAARPKIAVPHDVDVPLSGRLMSVLGTVLLMLV